MAGYGAVAMVRTPWGNAGELRERKLNPGQGTPREEVVRSQRERLYAATVASVSEKGYRDTSVADLVRLSGVSRASFYQHFADKRACFVATIEAILEGAVAIGAHRYQDEGPWEERAQSSLLAFIELLAAQPAAARMCAVEAYAAGAEALAPLERAVDRIEALVMAALDEQPQRRGTPPELMRAAIGGFHWVIYRHLNEGTERELVDCVPELWEWAMSYEPPPVALRARGRRGIGGAAGSGAPPFAAHIPTERVLRGFAAAVAEKGYSATTIADIAAAARISQATFYAHFEGKEDALLAALDSSGAQMIAATVPAMRRAKGWPEGVRTALDSIFGFLAAEPAFARLQAVEAYAVGPRAVALRNRIVEEVVEVTLALGLGQRPQPAPLALEATVGAIGSILFDRIRDEGPHVLPEAVPLATYVALAPFLGAEEACAVANGESRAVRERSG
jgi:AcrR family transcriptional regulator